MDRNKTSLVVIVLLAGFFFIAIAMVFNTSARRNAALNKKSAVEEKIASLNAMDLTIYWIGDVPQELESLKSHMQVLKPEEVTPENMPIKYTTFRIKTWNRREGEEPGEERDDSDATVIEPRKYSDYMMIVLNTGEGFSDGAKEVLRNCIVENGVPVLCLGGKACDLVGTILIHGAGYSSVYSMLYKLNEGYQEPFLDAKAVAAGGMDFAEELVGKLCTYFKTAEMNKYIEASERWSAAISSVDEAATAVTTTTETTSEPSVSETPETTESHRIAMESK